jgi:PhnB protein
MTSARDRSHPVPEGYHSLTPFLAVDGGAEAIDFYQRAFAATVVSRLDDPNGTVMQAELQIGDSRLQLSDPMPELGLHAPTGEGVTSSLVHYVEDVDAVFARAVEAGAVAAEPVSDFVTGDRYGVVIDPFGHRWVITTRVEDVSAEEAARRVREWAEARHP